MTEDADLLLRYQKEHSEAALAEFVRRHVDLVYCAALRRLSGNVHQAAEVTQQVFVTVSRRAEALSVHGNLIAWLHTATRHASLDLVKKEQRRLRHESAAAAMSIQEPDTNGATPEELGRLRGLLDGLLDTLPARDREALLLRHFEGRDFEEIARGQGISAEAARMRVSRALARLREALARRGLRSSTATFLSALAAEAATRAPAGLTSQVTAACLSGGAGLGLGVVGSSILFMNTVKGVCAACVCLALAGGWALSEHRRKAELSAGLETLAQAEGLGAQERAGLERRSQEALRKRTEAGTDLGVVRSLAASKGQEPEETPITAALVKTRYAKARELADQGRYKESLEEYLWCLDIGMVKIPSYSAVRDTELLALLGELAQKYPEAREALVSRRSKVRSELLEKPERRPDDFIAFSTAFGEQADMFVVYDSLPADDKRRQDFRLFAFEAFAAAGRYAEAAQGHSTAFMTFSYESRLQELSGPLVKDEKTKAELREILSRRTALDIEVLAGSGDLANASKMADRLLKDSLTTADRDRIQKSLTKAGHPELAKTYEAP